MITGVSTASLYPMETEKALRRLAENNVRNMEIFINTDCELRDPYVSEMLDIIRAYGLNIVSVHPYSCAIEPMMLFTAYERRVNDILGYYRRFFEFMNKVGAKYFILHGNKRGNPFPEEKSFERFARLQTAANEFGVSVLQENVARCTAGSLDSMLRMREQIGELAMYVLDTKQAVRAGESPVEIAGKLGDSIKHIHYSECSEKFDCVAYGEGKPLAKELFSALKSSGFNGAVMIELYAESFSGGAEFLAENCRKLSDDVISRL